MDKLVSRILHPSSAAAWLGMATLGALIWAMEFSYLAVSGLGDGIAGATPEGAVSGWWWAMSVIWLIEGLKRHERDGASGRPVIAVAVRVYLALALTALGVLDTGAQGLPGGLGFFAGVGAFAALYCLGDLTVAWVRSSGERMGETPHQPEQLPLPFL